jgi:DNA repair photolyase
MNGKPVLYRDAKTVLNVNNNAFKEKLLCGGVILNLGDACAYSCSFCYVGSMLRFHAPPVLSAYTLTHGVTLPFQKVVIRRQNAIDRLRAQLLDRKGRRRYSDDDDARVVFSSTTVDVAANMELLRETAEACNMILQHTGWHIRLLSKSNLLHLLVANEMIPSKYHHRLIFGFSTGTLHDNVAKAIESGSATVSKRLESLHWLQDNDFRTFGMICPSLPQDDYDSFSSDICAAIRVEKCEHVWAEPLNVRGESLSRTLAALRAAGLNAEANNLAAVSGAGKGKAWEDYARMTFLAHTKNIEPGKLRFLQYIDTGTAGWWGERRRLGAVLLGKTAKAKLLTAV